MSEERLWAPWRLEYIKGPKDEECIFCTGPAAEDDPAKYIVQRGEHCFAILNAFPYNNGHLMISPYRHVPSIEQLDPPTLTELMTMAQASMGALRQAYAPEGFNLGINQGRIAGAGMEHHVHLHVVPRWNGDTNFMPVIGDTRVLPQSLDDSYRDLTEAFRAAA
ncbi:MAG: adenylyltransferase [Solirubrobacteraceae bacterium]|jgi:ATP adenylyltransferase|nr:adenylyltransferase [Solirubrobacteraceae bacterium]